jgi:hypothetical protein
MTGMDACDEVDADDPLIERICSMARAVLRDPPHIGVLSTGEQCAVALVLNRLDLLPAHYSVPLEAFDRLGVVWATAAVHARKQMLFEGELEARNTAHGFGCWREHLECAVRQVELLQGQLKNLLPRA